MVDILIEPLEGEEHDGHQFGFLIKANGRPRLHATIHGVSPRGPRWSLTEVSDDPAFEPSVDVSNCDLDEMIAALTALRDSAAHRDLMPTGWS
jgi:hypothetical protein